MRTVMVPTLCALVLALSACGGDDDPAATTPAEEKIEQTTADQKQDGKSDDKSADKKSETPAEPEPGTATAKQRDGKTILVTKTKADASTLCQKFRDMGQTAAAGMSKFPIETDAGDYTCDLAKK